MALLERLPADAEDTQITITVNRRLAPYYRAWFQAKKQDGDNPSKFVVRLLKPLVINWYMEDTNAVIQLNNAETFADANALSEEVDDATA